MESKENAKSNPYPNLAQTMQTMQPVQTMPPVQPILTVQPVQTIQTIQPMQPVMATIQNPPLGPQPSQCVCPSCHNRITTNVTRAPGMKTHLIAILLLVTVCCCCIPYCVDSCKNALHNCPECGAYLGTYKT